MNHACEDKEEQDFCQLQMFIFYTIRNTTNM